MNNAATLRAFKTMAPEARIELLFQLWDQVTDDGWKPALDDQLRAEIEKRWDDYCAHPETGMTWEEVVSQIRKD